MSGRLPVARRVSTDAMAVPVTAHSSARDSERLRFVGTGRCIRRVLGPDVDFAVVQDADVQWHDSDPLFVDRLSVLTQVTLFDPFAGNGRNVGIEECRAPPLPPFVLERRTVTQEPSGEFSRTVGAGDLVGDAVVKVVRTLATLIGRPGPCRSERTCRRP